MLRMLTSSFKMHYLTELFHFHFNKQMHHLPCIFLVPSCFKFNPSSLCINIFTFNVGYVLCCDISRLKRLVRIRCDIEMPTAEKSVPLFCRVTLIVEWYWFSITSSWWHIPSGLTHLVTASATFAKSDNRNGVDPSFVNVISRDWFVDIACDIMI